MSEIKEKFGAANQNITITLNDLADDGLRESTIIDNSTNLFFDALVSIVVNVTAGAPAGEKNVLVYVYGTADGGTACSGAATGSDAAFGGSAGQLESNLIGPIGIVELDAASESFEGGPFSIANAFGGKIPQKWGIVVKNQSGQALAASGNSAHYQGILAQSG